MSNHKIMQQDENLFLFSFKKPKTKSLSYKLIGIDQDDGPYLCKHTNKYKVDTLYYSFKDIYSVQVTDILREEKMVAIHEHLLYNKYKWPSFRKWFDSKANKIAPRASLYTILYQDERYIVISWIPSQSELMAYPGYEKYVAVCGGKAIDTNKIVDNNLKFIFVNDRMWYIDAGEYFDVVAAPNKTNIEKLHLIMCHQKKMKSIRVLRTALRRAPGKLKAVNVSKPYKFTATLADFVWADYLENVLIKFDIKAHRKWNKMSWRMSFRIAHCIFKGNFFAKISFDQLTGDMITIFVSHIKVSLSLKTGTLIFRGFVLKQVEDQTFGLKCLPKDSVSEFHISMLDFPDSLLSYLFDFLSYQDLKICKNVCLQSAILSITKLKKFK